MTTFLRVLQEAGQHGAEAVEHGAETVQHGAEQAAGGVPDIGGMLMHHLADARRSSCRGGVWHLPHWEPRPHLGGFTIDLSPTKHVVFMAPGGHYWSAVLFWPAQGGPGDVRRAGPQWDGQRPGGHDHLLPGRDSPAEHRSRRRRIHPVHPHALLLHSYHEPPGPGALGSPLPRGTSW